MFKICLLKFNCAEYLWYPRYYTFSSQPSVVISAVSVCLAHSVFSSPFSCCLCTWWFSQVYSMYLMGWPLSFSVHFVVWQLTALLWIWHKASSQFFRFSTCAQTLFTSFKSIHPSSYLTLSITKVHLGGKWRRMLGMVASSMKMLEHTLPVNYLSSIYAYCENYGKQPA